MTVYFCLKITICLFNISKELMDLGHVINLRLKELEDFAISKGIFQA